MQPHTPDQIIAATREHFATQMLDLLFRMGRQYDREAHDAYEAYEESRQEQEFAYEHDDSERAWEAWQQSRESYATYQHARGMNLACEKHRIYIREFLDEIPTLADLNIPDAQQAEAPTVEVSE
ncbi:MULTISPECIES: hypothetical protein [Actinomycetaceae]|uniref:Uncharacterized protein n=1 Tax=Actinotignum sanguinis TaxID=1445614 RepID=A0ABT5V9B1_9ACTO|nr:MULTISPECIES: hypothetical protein [Actinotignum]MDE1552509.1 hypothetical protein [Actinotignum sanguinis]MDE1642027.1 hypothetical protein [Actinotignum sanguinis]MDE1657200.1 hypothetical protein [Actinotignum sanguinis]MDK6907410.1 hypothetical protein [Actinotignum timonense]MDK8352738.1 hypothetical protein [Actinotignum sanguinis]